VLLRQIELIQLDMRRVDLVLSCSPWRTKTCMQGLRESFCEHVPGQLQGCCLWRQLV